jgi:plastocyanin
MRVKQYAAATLAALTLVACGGGGAATGPGDNGGNNPGGSTFADLSVSPASGTVEVGGTFQLATLATDGAGNVIQNAPAPSYLTSDAARATVDANGLVTGVAPGAVIIKAVLTHAGRTDSAQAALTVVPKPPTGPAAVFTSLTITPDFGTVAVGGTLALTATPRDQNGQPMAGLPAASWTLSDAARASISGGVVTGRAAGTVTVTASVTAGGVTRTASASVTVTETGGGSAPSSATVMGIEDAFSPSTVTIAVGGTVTWTMDDEEHDVTWVGAAPPGGDIPRLDEGESASRTFPVAGTYAYRCDRHHSHPETGTVVVKEGVTQNPVFTSLTLSPTGPAVQVGSAVQLSATPRDQNGAPMSGLGTPTWSTSDATKATVDASGRVTGVAAGTATITASLTAGGTTRTGSVTVTVITTPPTTPPSTNPSTATVTTSGATFTPRSVTIAPGGSVTWQMSGDRHNVTFSGAAPTGGNIPDTESGRSATRTFPNAGTYNYTCTRHNGMSGTVVVQ